MSTWCIEALVRKYKSCKKESFVQSFVFLVQRTKNYLSSSFKPYFSVKCYTTSTIQSVVKHKHGTW